jgi:Fic family protein
MNPKDFKSPSSGHVIRLPQGFHAFIPAPLPPEITYDSSLALLLSRADAALSELSGLGRHLPNPHLLITPYTRREAVLSSRIEGTQASLSDVLIDELNSSSSPTLPDDVREIRNYIRATELGVRRLGKIPFGVRLVKELHAQLMTGVRGHEKTPGEFRRSQNWIGPAGANPATAAYVPPPLHEMHEAISNWEKFVNRRDLMPELVQCAIMHQQFESIHPFLDGNGRIGRLLITLFLIDRKRLSQPLLYLSAYIEAHRQEYYDLLQRVRTHGDWSAWIKFFLTGVTETATQAVHQADTLVALRTKTRKRLGKNLRAQTLLDALFINPYVTVTRAKEILGVSHPTAAAAIAALQRIHMLRPTTDRSWGRVYISLPILKTIERPIEHS